MNEIPDIKFLKFTAEDIARFEEELSLEEDESDFIECIGCERMVRIYDVYLRNEINFNVLALFCIVPYCYDCNNSISNEQ